MLAHVILYGACITIGKYNHGAKVAPIGTRRKPHGSPSQELIISIILESSAAGINSSIPPVAHDIA